MEERRINDGKLALIEQRLDLSLKSLDGKMDLMLANVQKDLSNLIEELRKYNGIRERLENACKDIKDHEARHYKFAGLLIAAVTAILGISKLLAH